MPRTVSVNSFTFASAAYAEKAIAKANANNNAYLTKTEAKALPTDLQDNFAAYRARTFNGVVSAKSFAKDYAATVKEAAKRADANRDGVISATEMAKLPANLQDNFANFAGVAKPVALEPITSLSLPLSKTNIEKVRAAMVDFVENHLTMRTPSEFDEGFEYENGSWARLVHEFGGDDEHEALKREMLDMAENWTPSSDWQADTSSDGGIYFTGAFKFMTTWISLDKGKVPQIDVEID